MVSMVRSWGLVIGFAFVALGCRGSESEARSEPAEAPVEESEAKTPADEPAAESPAAEAEVEAPTGAPPPAADPERTRACRTYATETAQACREFLRKGGTATCLQHFGNVLVALEQSQGNLFDDVEPPPDPRDSPMPCEWMLKNLRREREAQALQEHEWGPKCLKLFEWLESNCLDALGSKRPADGCLLSLGMAGGKDPTVRGAENDCNGGLLLTY